MYNGTGTVIYDPPMRIKHEDWWCIVKTDLELVRYYQSQLLKLFDLQFEKTVWGSHISVVRGTKPPKLRPWMKYNRQKFTFTYDGQIYRVRDFFVIDVECEAIENLRVELGLPAKLRKPFHITIGRLKTGFYEKRKLQLAEFCAKAGIPEINNPSLYPLFNNRGLT